MKYSRYVGSTAELVAGDRRKACDGLLRSVMCPHDCDMAALSSIARVGEHYLLVESFGGQPDDSAVARFFVSPSTVASGRRQSERRVVGVGGWCR